MKKKWIGYFTLLLSVLLIGLYQKELGMLPASFFGEARRQSDLIAEHSSSIHWSELLPNWTDWTA
jgi:hypothetical protein